VNKMSENKEKTTIQLYKTTRDKLKNLGSKGESYDTIIQRLIKLKENKK